MQFTNQKEETPLSFYQERFAAADPNEISQRLGLPFENGALIVPLLGTTYRISHPDCIFTADCDDTLGVSVPAVQVLLLRLVLLGKPAPETNDFVTFRELPWGEVYQKSFAQRITNRAAYIFGASPGMFRIAAQKLGGRPIAQGDTAYEFDFTENYRMQLIIQTPEGDAPAHAQVLYSANFPFGFSADDRLIAAETLLYSLKQFF